MGWMRTLLLGDIGNRLDIGDNENQIKDMRRVMRRNRTEKGDRDQSQDAAIATLQAEVDDLKIALGTLGTLLVKNGHIQASEWEYLIQAIDAEDET